MFTKVISTKARVSDLSADSMQSKSKMENNMVHSVAELKWKYTHLLVLLSQSNSDTLSHWNKIGWDIENKSEQGIGMDQSDFLSYRLGTRQQWRCQTFVQLVVVQMNVVSSPDAVKLAFKSEQ